MRDRKSERDIGLFLDILLDRSHGKTTSVFGMSRMSRQRQQCLRTLLGGSKPGIVDGMVSAEAGSVLGWAASSSTSTASSACRIHKTM